MRAEIEGLLLDGFFPFCDAAARPYRTQAALREWGLPYPTDSAVTRHLAEFLSDRPRIDAVLFNGGSVRPPLLRRRLREQIGAWQDGFMPQVLENDEPDLAVARGAARFGVLLHHRSGRIAAGAAAAIFLEAEGIHDDGRPDRASASRVRSSSGCGAVSGSLRSLISGSSSAPISWCASRLIPRLGRVGAGPETSFPGPRANFTRCRHCRQSSERLSHPARKRAGCCPWF